MWIFILNKKHSQERLGEHYTYFECLTTFFYMFSRVLSYKVTQSYNTSPEQGVASSCLPSLYSVAPYAFSLFYAMKSAATGTDLAIGNTGLGIVGHLGCCHRKHLISYCLHLKPLPKYCQSMAAAPNQTSAFVIPLFLMWPSCWETECFSFSPFCPLRQVKLNFTHRKRIDLNATVVTVL